MVSLLEQCVAQSKQLCAYAMEQWKETKQRGALTSVVEQRHLLSKDWKQAIIYMPRSAFGDKELAALPIVDTYDPYVSCVLLVIYKPHDQNHCMQSMLLNPNSYLDVAHKKKPTPATTAAKLPHEEKCGACNKRDCALSLCARCKMVQYCSKECQVKDWKARHKLQCVRHQQK
jgi:hypothetical protein